MNRAFPAGHIAVELVWQGEFLPETGLWASHGGAARLPHRPLRLETCRSVSAGNSAIAVIQSLGPAGQQCAGDRSLAPLSLVKGSHMHEVSHATSMFIGARVVYLPAYLSGIPMLRSLAYRLEVLQTSQELNQTGV